MKKSIMEKWGIYIVNTLSLDKKALKFSRERKIFANLDSLSNDKEATEKLYCAYLGKKLGYMICGIVLLTLFVIGRIFLSNDKGELVENVLYRNENGGLNKEINLFVKSEGMQEKITVNLDARHYTKDELDSMAKDVFEFIEGSFLSADNLEEQRYTIKEDMVFPEKLEDYPFTIIWESSNKDILDDDGTILKKGSTEESVFLTIVLNCYEYEWEKIYEVYIYSENKSWTEEFKSAVENAVENENRETLQNIKMVLPQEIDGHQITYEEIKDDSTLVLILLGIIVLVLIGFLMNSNLKARVEERNKQLLYDYTSFVSKMSLYLGVGLSLHTTLVRISENTNKKSLLHNELERVVHEIDNGVSDIVAIEGLAKRCQLTCYIKLSVLIQQNIKKGNNKLCEQLKTETEKAFNERKNNARKFGEEAGTKLLFPMMLMLVVVMIMIMYPAFISFSV